MEANKVSKSHGHHGKKNRTEIEMEKE